MPARPFAAVSRRSALVAAAFSALPRLAVAQARPYTIVVPFPAGGGTDMIARSVGRHLGGKLGAPVVIDNRAGAGGLIGASALLQAPPDGQTLFLSSNSVFTINPALRASLPYDPASSFAGIGVLGTAPLAILVKSTSPIRALKDLVADAKRRPGELTYASFGQGSVSHFAGELFKHEEKLDMLHVPYRGSAAAMQALLGDQVAIAFDTITAAIPQMRSGTVRCLAVTSSRRDENLPDVPTVAEAAFPGFNFLTWVALVTRRDAPQGAISQLKGAFRETMTDPHQIKDLRQLGLDVRGIETLDFDRLVAQEVPRYRALAARAGIKMDV